MSTRTPSPERATLRWISTLWFVGVLAFALLLGWSLYKERNDRVAQARIETDNLSHVLEEHALATLQKIDLVIVDILSHLEPEDMRHDPDAPGREGGRAAALNRLLAAKVRGLGEADLIYVANAEGRYIYGSLDKLPAINVSDRHYFAVSRDNPSAGLVISPPLISRTLGTWAITLSRRISFPDGQFAGVVNVVVQLTSLERFYQSLNLGKHGAVLMRDGEMRLLARHPPLVSNMGQSMPGHPVLGMLSRGIQRGSYEEVSPADGVRRLYSYRRVGDTTLFVLAGIAVEDYLEQWRAHVFWYVLAGLLIAGVTFTLAMIARRGIVAQASAEKELEQYNLCLERLVDERTRELESARAAAETASRAKSAFLANMSHELRTPLNAILGFAQLLMRKGELSDEAERQVGKIERAGRHLLTLINSVLNISRIEAGRIEIAREPFNLREAMANAMAMVQAGAEAKGLALQVEECPGLAAWVLGDEGHFRQILINLLGNAIKYTERGSVLLRVSREASRYCFEVIDSGPGIDTQYQERIFQPFFQAERGVEAAEGVGLGLSISREYAQLMGGALTVESAVGQGSTFTLILPLPESPGQQVPAAAVSFRLRAGQAARRVLVADDEDDAREVVRELLVEAGLEVRVVDNGKQAVEAFVDWKPALIWMDMGMPVLDGYEATRRIRALAGGDKVKIVAFTADAFEERRRLVMDAGCDDVLYKPLDTGQLFATMGRLLEADFNRVEKPANRLGTRLEPADLAVLSKDVRQRLRAAATGLDIAQTREILGELRLTHAELAARLDVLAQAFLFERIASLCGDGDAPALHG